MDLLPLPYGRQRKSMSYTQKKRLCEVRVTLDGKPAMIAGATLPFAKVCHIPWGNQVAFAWETVKQIVDKGGQFRS